MNAAAFDAITTLFDASGATYRVYKHTACRSSAESMATREALGITDAIGAKALLCKLYFKGWEETFATIVLPGTHVLDKVKFKSQLGLKMFRFATAEELMDIAGVEYGCMPPFGSQVFPKVSKLYVSEALKDFPNVAFNAAYLEKSIVLPTEEYFRTINPDLVFDCSQPKAQ